MPANISGTFSLMASNDGRAASVRRVNSIALIPPSIRDFARGTASIALSMINTAMSPFDVSFWATSSFTLII